MLQSGEGRTAPCGAPRRDQAARVPGERRRPGRGGATLWQEMARRWTATGAGAARAAQSAAAPSSGSASASAGRGRSDSRAWI
jgi:hypothetical protein